MNKVKKRKKYRLSDGAKRFFHAVSLAVALLSFTNYNAQAQTYTTGEAGCAKILSGHNVRDSYQWQGVGTYEESREYIKACVLEGYDPPHGGKYTWIPRGGRGHGALSGSNIQFPSGRADARCPPSVLPQNQVCHDKDWPNCNGSPGGLSQDGGPGTDSCIQTSNETGTATIAAEGEPEPVEIEAPEEEFSCGVEFGAAFSGGIGEGHACASGGIGFCGIGISGSACIDANGLEVSAEYTGPNGRYSNIEGYHEIHDIPVGSALEFATYVQDNPNSNFILPEGGNIDFGNGEISVEVTRADGTTETVQMSSLSLPADAFISARLRAESLGDNGTLIVTPDATYRIPFDGTTRTADPRDFSITSNNNDFVFTKSDATQLDNVVPTYVENWITNITEAKESLDKENNPE